MPPAKENNVGKEHKQKVKAKKRNYAESIASSNTTGNVEEETKVAQKWLDCLLNEISEAKKLALELRCIRHQSELVMHLLAGAQELENHYTSNAPKVSRLNEMVVMVEMKTDLNQQQRASRHCKRMWCWQGRC
jgi:hypothetical protein